MDANLSITSDKTTPRFPRWLLVFILLGLAWRGLRYFLQFPIWGDEAMLCLNLVDQDYQGLTQPLRHGQVAPLLFLWGELTSYLILGPSELALRLLPFLAGAGALFLFWQLCRATLQPSSATMAVGLLAVSYYPVRHACEVKPYAFDLFMAVMLMLPAALCLKNPMQRRYLVLLTALVPVAIGFSYPAVFIASSISVVLLPGVIASRQTATWLLFFLYNVILAGSFLGSHSLVGNRQVADESLNHFLQDYWRDWLPERDPASLVKWLVQSHTGNMMAYPLGGPNGASSLTLLLCVVGAGSFWRSGNRQLLSLCVLPFVLSMLAALVHRYPYGGSARLAQHLAPAICILAGTGLAAILSGLRSNFEARRRWITASFAGLFMVGGIGLARDLLQPFKTQGEIRARTLVEELRARTDSMDNLVILNPTSTVKATFQWYLAPDRKRLIWEDEISEASLGAERIWCLRFWDPLPYPAIASRLGNSWVLAHGEEHAIPGDRRSDPIERVQLTCWVRR